MDEPKQIKPPSCQKCNRQLQVGEWVVPLAFSDGIVYAIICKLCADDLRTE